MAMTVMDGCDAVLLDRGIPIGVDDTPAGASEKVSDTPAGVSGDVDVGGSGPVGVGQPGRSSNSGMPSDHAEPGQAGGWGGDLGDLDLVALERLEYGLMTLAAHLAAGEARWLTWLGAYDRRAGWETWGCRSAAEWLNNKCGMSLTAGRERVRVARALQDLPLTQTAFVNGELSYSKVRAITRAATPDSEPDLLDIARSSTASQLDQICGGVANARPPADQDDVSPSDDTSPSEDALLLAKQFAASRSNSDGTSTLRVCLADDTMAMVVAAIDSKVNELITDMTQGKELTRRQAIDHHGGYPALRARALATVITDGGTETTVMLTIPIDTLNADDEEPTPSDTAKPQSSTATDEQGQPQPMPDTEGQQPPPQPDDEPPQVPRHEAPPQSGAEEPQSPSPKPAPESEPPRPQVDGSTDSRGGLRSTVARLLCDCRINMTVVDEYDGPLSIGRRSRVIPTKIRTALELRDHGICRFPGCGSTRSLQAHHVIHWQHGGPTDLSNLVLLCWFHHDLLHNQAANDAGSVADHQGCWTVEPVPTGESKAGGWFRFRTPDGDLATIEHSRGSVNALYWYPQEHPDPDTDQPVPLRRTRLEPINGGRLQDLSWITTAIIHNETNQRRHRHRNQGSARHEHEEPTTAMRNEPGATSGEVLVDS